MDTEKANRLENIERCANYANGLLRQIDLVVGENMIVYALDEAAKALKSDDDLIAVLEKRIEELEKNTSS